jgi:two-component system phosphate regulon sensor histidine kinase PhoR
VRVTKLGRAAGGRPGHPVSWLGWGLAVLLGLLAAGAAVMAGEARGGGADTGLALAAGAALLVAAGVLAGTVALMASRALAAQPEGGLAAKVKALERTKSGFLDAVSHELRTPLTSIAGFVEMLRDEQAGPLTPAQDRMLAAVDRNTARLRNLIEDVLTLSRIESGVFRTTRQPVSLSEILAAGVAALQPAAAARGVTVGLDGPPGRVIVAGDPGQLHRLVMNLLSNALKFTPGGGRVTAAAAASGTTATLTIADTGIGIPAAEQTAVGTRFFRASNAVDRSIPGTGLGLAIARTIAASHGGELMVRSAEGSGTTVVVRIPLLAAVRAAPAGITGRAGSRPRPGRPGPAGSGGQSRQAAASAGGSHPG